MIRHSLIITLVATLFACQTSKRSSGYQGELSGAKVSDSSRVTCEWNATRRFQLCYSKGDDGAARPLDFLVYSQENDSVIFERSLVRGYVKWVGESTVEYLSQPGMIKEGESTLDYVKLLDVSTGKEWKKNSETNSSKP